jgi:hypothetical protein
MKIWTELIWALVVAIVVVFLKVQLDLSIWSAIGLAFFLMLIIIVFDFRGSQNEKTKKY